MSVTSAVDEKVQVKVEKRGDAWVLLRNGEPYFVRGVGGKSQLDTLAHLGGNSIRTWGHDELNEREWSDGKTETLPDRAERFGLTIAAGFWMGHQRHGFDYTNEDAVKRQTDEAIAWVREWKDHPAILVWGVGNEVELAGDTDQAFKAINDLARAIKAEDPSRPTMTCIAGVWPDKAADFMRLCPDVDILGINAYGGLSQVPDELHRQKMTKPYIVTEYGPRGHWESPTTEWGVSYEQSSAQKAAHLHAGYMAAILEMPKQCLGGYAFVWGQKQERTGTWYGLLTSTGERVAATDTLSRFWRNAEPDNRAPLASAIDSELSGHRVEPGAVFEATAIVSDPDGDPLDIEWEVRAESNEQTIGGDAERVPALIEGCIVETDGHTATVRTPEKPGAYRLFMIARDGLGGAGTANTPFFVGGDDHSDEDHDDHEGHDHGG